MSTGSATAGAPSSASSAPPAPTIVATESWSAICAAAELNPTVPAGDCASTRYATAEKPNPIPRPATIQNGTASQPMPHAGATSSIPAAPMPTATKPIRSSRARGRSGWRPCHHDAADQHSEPATSGKPAAASDQPCVSCSISGRNALTVKNVPASSPREATTVGIPRPARNTPRGSNTRSDGASTSTAATATTAPTASGCCPAQLSAATPTAAPTAAAAVPRRAAWRSPAGPSVRTAGATSASATTTNGTSPRNTQCQDNVSVTSPDTGGPSSDGSTHADEISPNTAGRTRSG